MFSDKQNSMTTNQSHINHYFFPIVHHPLVQGTLVVVGEHYKSKILTSNNNAKVSWIGLTLLMHPRLWHCTFSPNYHG